MKYDPRLQLDMTADGQFRPPVSTRIMAWAVVVAVVAGGLSFALFALWLALLLVPVMIVAVAVAVLALRFKLWQARRRSGSFGGDRFVVRRP